MDQTKGGVLEQLGNGGEKRGIATGQAQFMEWGRRRNQKIEKERKKGRKENEEEPKPPLLQG